MQKTIIEFLDHRGGKYNGYGYSIGKDQVVSFKRNSLGHLMESRSSYRLNGHYVDHSALKSLALWIAGHQVADKPKPVATHPHLAQVIPSFSYVVYSNKNQASQFFFVGTPLSDAFAMFAKRGEILDPDEVSILNTVSGLVFKLQRTVTYTLV